MTSPQENGRVTQDFFRGWVGFIRLAIYGLGLIYAWSGAGLTGCYAGGRTEEADNYVVYIPAGIAERTRVPLVFALSPGADAATMVRTWKEVGDQFKWVIAASRSTATGSILKLFSPKCPRNSTPWRDATLSIIAR